MNAAGSPAPNQLLGLGSRKFRLSCSLLCRCRRRCCCCGRFAELRGSESRLGPLPAAVMKWMFKEDHSLEHRCVESAKIRAKYPDRVPVIVEKVSGSQIVDIDKRKYLVPSDITVAQFMWIIRKRIQLPSEKAIFLFVDKTVPQSSLTMGQLYEKEKDEDGFLYVAYSGENTFGF
uniref:Gamma-aminobutyric acid receptor-associated protein-like 2 n=1 Tax=Heterocephalus glaber TaxID=10181 RepID=A0A0P6J366_HETGA